ncbi:phage portal protein [Escherichia coli]|nr:phage portal protein [Escherichia coli]
MRLTAVFSCVRVLAESVGMLPCNLYHLNGSLKQRATGERLHKLISTHPNGYMTPQEFWELVVTCLCLRGNFYAYKVKAFGEVAELLPVDPGCVATGLYQVPLSAAQPGDVLLCCFGSSVPNHAAIYCGDGELLNHIPEQLSKRERYTDKWQRRTHSLWRHRAWHASAFTGICNDLAAASTFV